MKLIWDNGLIIESETRRVILDPQIKHVRSDLTLISHAHIDHIQGLNPEHTLISSKETYEILKARVACSSKKHIQLNRRQLYEDTDFKITPYNSGHVLGSFQYFIESEEGSILYSSDINCVRSLTTPEAESVEAETLILESTYGRPEYALPPREEIYVEIVEWCLRTLSEGKIPVFKAYSLGKSQELIKLVNNYLQIPVIVDPYIAAISEVYDKSGVRLKFLTQGEEEAERFLNQKSGILIVSSF
ncbi:MAG: MBL fold metallo-hydrolase, partial [Candidatus Odinarchaeota archaeon]